MGLAACMGKIMLNTIYLSHNIADIFSKLAFWVALCGFLGATICNFLNLNTTVSMFSQLTTMPTYQCSIIFGTLIGGGYMMSEFEYYTNNELAIIFIGSLICVTGILFKVCVVEKSDI